MINESKIGMKRHDSRKVRVFTHLGQPDVAIDSKGFEPDMANWTVNLDSRYYHWGEINLRSTIERMGPHIRPLLIISWFVFHVEPVPVTILLPNSR